jgi:hypothetical protein
MAPTYNIAILPILCFRPDINWEGLALHSSPLLARPRENPECPVSIRGAPSFTMNRSVTADEIRDQSPQRFGRAAGATASSPNPTRNPRSRTRCSSKCLMFKPWYTLPDSCVLTTLASPNVCRYTFVLRLADALDIAIGAKRCSLEGTTRWDSNFWRAEMCRLRKVISCLRWSPFGILGRVAQSTDIELASASGAGLS